MAEISSLKSEKTDWYTLVKGNNNASTIPEGTNGSIQPDVIIVKKLRLVGGCSEDAMINCGVHDIMVNAQHWMTLINEIHYFLLPCIVILGILLAFINCIVLLRQIRSSVDCYILGMIIASLLLLVCSVIINIKLYIGNFDIFGYLYGYVRSLQEWFWYTTIWLLIIMCLERCMNVSGTRNKSICSPFQAGITIVMTYLVCLVSTLPRFWEYEPINHYHPHTNQTSIVAFKSASTNTPEYNVMYYWYIKIFSLFLPIPVLIIVLFILCCCSKKPSAPTRQLSKKNSTGQVLKRKVTEERRITQLLITLILTYILLTSPYVVIKFLYKIHATMVVSSNVTATEPFFATLEKLFQLVFYLNYTLHFLWLICFNWGYRKAFRNTCCCCCCGKDEAEYEPAPQQLDYYN